MLNTFVVRKNAMVQTLDDLVIYKVTEQTYRISGGNPLVWAESIGELSAYIREVPRDLRSALQKIDDEIEALMFRREDLRNQAFGQGLDINPVDLEDYLESYVGG